MEEDECFREGRRRMCKCQGELSSGSLVYTCEKVSERIDNVKTKKVRRLRV